MRGRGRSRSPAILVFGEDDNDRRVLEHLVRALRADAPRVERRHKPLVLVRDREAARARKNAADIAAEVRRSGVRHDVKLVIAHQDCDAVEPAHVDLGRTISDQLAGLAVPVVPATPAWEMEAWFFLWPDAVVAVNHRWRRPAMSGRAVGLIRDAKEAFRRALRPRAGGSPPRDYEESDAPKIAQKVRELGLVDAPDAVSDSFTAFADAIRRAAL